MNLLKLSLASALLTVGIAVTAPLSAAQIGGPVSNPRDPGAGMPWTATVCFGDPGSRNVQCQVLFFNTGSLCQSTVLAWNGMGWWTRSPCEPTSP
jgi:hypothetical protein